MLSQRSWIYKLAFSSFFWQWTHHFFTLNMSRQPPIVKFHSFIWKSWICPCQRTLLGWLDHLSPKDDPLGLFWPKFVKTPNSKNNFKIWKRRQGEGSGSKKSCQANMKDLLTGKSTLFRELQNSAALLNFEVRKFDRVSYKKGRLNWNFRRFTCFWTTFPIWVKFC